MTAEWGPTNLTPTHPGGLYTRTPRPWWLSRLVDGFIKAARIFWLGVMAGVVFYLGAVVIGRAW